MKQFIFTHRIEVILADDLEAAIKIFHTRTDRRYKGLKDIEVNVIPIPREEAPKELGTTREV